MTYQCKTLDRGGGFRKIIHSRYGFFLCSLLPLLSEKIISTDNLQVGMFVEAEIVYQVVDNE